MEFEELRDEYIQITAEEYQDALEHLNSREFTNKYSKVINGNDYDYYKRAAVYNGIAEAEVDTYLLYEILKSQRRSENGINIIKYIMVFFLIISVVWLVVGISAVASLS